MSMDANTIMGFLGGGTVATVLTALIYWRKTQAETNNIRVDGDGKVVDMALKYAAAVNDDLKMVKEQLGKARHSLRDAEDQIDYLETTLRRYADENLKLCAALRKVNPDHPLLQHMENDSRHIKGE